MPSARLSAPRGPAMVLACGWPCRLALGNLSKVHVHQSLDEVQIICEIRHLRDVLVAATPPVDDLPEDARELGGVLGAERADRRHHAHGLRERDLAVPILVDGHEELPELQDLLLGEADLSDGGLLPGEPLVILDLLQL